MIIYIYHKPWLTSWNFHPSRRFTMFFRDETIRFHGVSIVVGDPQNGCFTIFTMENLLKMDDQYPHDCPYETSSTTIWKKTWFQHGLTIWKTMLFTMVHHDERPLSKAFLGWCLPKDSASSPAWYLGGWPQYETRSNPKNTATALYRKFRKKKMNKGCLEVVTLW